MAAFLTAPRATPRDLAAGFGAGGLVGILGGMIGLGGAEFRLPLLISVFGFVALHAVIMNKALSLVVVITALPARLLGVPWHDVAPHWTVVVNLLAGSMIGAWLGATWATKMRTATLYRVLAVLMVVIGALLLLNHFGTIPSAHLAVGWRIPAGVLAGVGVGVIAAVMGVAGGEFLIPTIILLFAVDARIAGSLSLAVSLPTMLVAFARYSRDSSFSVLSTHRRFLLAMAVGSVGGTVLGGFLLGAVSEDVLIPLLVGLLLLSAWKVNQHA